MIIRIIRKTWGHRGFPFRLLKAVFYKLKFRRFGWLSYVNKPLRIDGAKRISVGNKCTIQYKTWLAALPLTGQDAQLVIEDGCNIGNFNHIYSTHSVILRRNVLTADKVYISDNLHGYEDITIPICRQPIVQKPVVEIGEGSWLGENVCVIGAKIGKHCVIGANSVVTKDIPDYSIAVGAPAKVIKQYDFNENKWKRFDSKKGDEAPMGGVISSVSYLKRKPFFKKYHFTDVIKSPIIITPHCIELGENVHIGYHARIEGVERWNNKTFSPQIIFGDGASVQQNLHLTCANRVVIGANTAIAANVTITDIHHSYDDVEIPIEHQMIQVKEVIIGEDCKIYNNAVILPGVHIGKHVTIGANSVVNHDIPEYSVAVGNPANVVKKYNFETKEWIKVQ